MRTESALIFLAAVAFMSCAAQLDGSCTGLSQVECCNETTTDCGWCGSEAPACYNKTDDQCKGEGADKCSEAPGPAPTCDSHKIDKDCCNATGCAWCGKDPTFKCYDATDANCTEEGENQCEAPVPAPTCDSHNNDKDCCNATGCAWCGKDPTFKCYDATDANCTEEGANQCDQPEPSPCDNLNQTACCDLSGCGYCGNDTSKECYNASSQQCKAEGVEDVCKTPKCTDQVAEKDCCNLTTACGWCGKETFKCYDLESEECNKTVSENLCEAPVCDGLSDTDCCSKKTDCGLCPNASGAFVCQVLNSCHAGANQCTTTPAPNTTTTVAPTSPKPTSTAAPATGGRGQHFDAASFIGGIALTVGIFGIAVFGYKYYSAKKDGNYHTL